MKYIKEEKDDHIKTMYAIERGKMKRKKRKELTHEGEKDIIEDIDVDLLSESTGNWVRVFGLSIGMKVNSLANRVRNEDDLSKKMDLISDMIRYTSYMSMTVLGAELSDKRLVSKIMKSGSRK